MLAEKFFLLLETIISNRSTDSAPRVVSASPHVPVKLPIYKFAAPGDAAMPRVSARTEIDMEQKVRKSKRQDFAQHNDRSKQSGRCGPCDSPSHRS
jgi:hypothetical protein